MKNARMKKIGLTFGLVGLALDYQESRLTLRIQQHQLVKMSDSPRP